MGGEGRFGRKGFVEFVMGWDGRVDGGFTERVVSNGLMWWVVRYLIRRGGLAVRMKMGGNIIEIQ